MNDADARGNRAPGLALLWGTLVALLAAWNVRDAVGFDFLAWGDDAAITLTLERPPVLALAHAAAGLSPTGYHAANVALHSVNALLLFALALRLLRHWRATDDDRWLVSAAGLGALCWSLHPLRAAAIGWASALPVGVATCLILMAAHIGWRERGRSNARLFVAGLLLAPALALYPTAGADANVLWPGASDLVEPNLFARALRGACMLAGYLAKTLVPASLSPAPTSLLDFTAADWRGWASVVALAAITWAAWRPRWRLLWLGYLALMLPGLGLGVPRYFPCDHYGHAAALALGVAVALALTRARPGPWRDWTGLVVCGALVAGAVAQRFALAAWRDSDALFDRAAETANDAEFHAAIYGRWARFHGVRGEAEEAQEILLRAAKVGVPPAEIFARLDEVANARRAPRLPLVQRHEELAAQAGSRLRLREAREQLAAALALAPDSAATRLRLALVCVRADDLELALHLYLRATANVAATTPGERVAAARSLAKALHHAGRAQLAWRLLERVLRDAPPEDSGGLREELERYRRAALKPSLG